MSLRKTMLDGFFYEKDPTGTYNLYFRDPTGEHKDRFFRGPEVAIGFTRDDPDAVCISHHHGSPESVRRWAQKQRFEAMFDGNDAHFSPFVVSSEEWEVEDLNSIINEVGKLGPVLKKMGLEVKEN